MVYIAATITSMVLFARATTGEGVAAQLEGIAGMDVSKTLGLLWLATATDATALDAGAASAPLQLAGLLGGPVTSFMWYPVLLFEVALAQWLIIRGVAAP